MQIVIDIPKEQYSLIMQSHRNGVERFISKEAMMYAIKNGTPLPKGHGKLKDEDEISLRGIHFKTELDHARMIGRLNSAPTIIEADKGE